MDKRLREQVQVIEAAGFVVKRITRNGTDHLRAHVDTPLGERYLVISITPGLGKSAGIFWMRQKVKHLKREIERAAVPA